jgi:hypothetical protein
MNNGGRDLERLLSLSCQLSSYNENGTMTTAAGEKHRILFCGINFDSIVWSIQKGCFKINVMHIEPHNN